MTKLVIVMRKDLNMRAGKMIAQGCHATQYILNQIENAMMTGAAWRGNNYKKVCVRVDSEEEFRTIWDNVTKDKSINYKAIVCDAGLTEFKGVPTQTCFAVLGPDEKVDKHTGHLKLL